MNQSDSLYEDAIKQFAQAGHGHGQLAAATGAAKLDNPLCGDRVRVQVAVASDHIAAIAHDTKGCLLCRAAAAVIGLRAVGQDELGIEAITTGLESMLKHGSPVPAAWPELSMFEPARAYPSRHRCVLLPFRALLAALQESRRSQHGDIPVL
ncbi:MAG: iron-sulfur cluster assembly scaffold protein [Sulfuritalea sp.]|jgi:NifU-like protein involved in Fe-S cluster formation|nr:iron-sulfur cluster assembly scaffold protein [Sulfuritalea sp.]